MGRVLDTFEKGYEKIKSMFSGVSVKSKVKNILEETQNKSQIPESFQTRSVKILSEEDKQKRETLNFIFDRISVNTHLDELIGQDFLIFGIQGEQKLLKIEYESIFSPRTNRNEMHVVFYFPNNGKKVFSTYVTPAIRDLVTKTFIEVPKLPRASLIGKKRKPPIELLPGEIDDLLKKSLCETSRQEISEISPKGLPDISTPMESILFPDAKKTEDSQISTSVQTKSTHHEAQEISIHKKNPSKIKQALRVTTLATGAILLGLMDMPKNQKQTSKINIPPQPQVDILPLQNKAEKVQIKSDVPNKIQKSLDILAPVVSYKMKKSETIWSVLKKQGKIRLIWDRKGVFHGEKLAIIKSDGTIQAPMTLQSAKKIRTGQYVAVCDKKIYLQFVGLRNTEIQTKRFLSKNNSTNKEEDQNLLKPLRENSPILMGGKVPDNSSTNYTVREKDIKLPRENFLETSKRATPQVFSIIPKNSEEYLSCLIEKKEPGKKWQGKELMLQGKKRAIFEELTYTGDKVRVKVTSIEKKQSFYVPIEMIEVFPSFPIEKDMKLFERFVDEKLAKMV